IGGAKQKERRLYLHGVIAFFCPMFARALAVFVLVFSCFLEATPQSNTASDDSLRIAPKTIQITDNVSRYILDYTISDELGLNQMFAPVGWTEPIVRLQFELRGIVIGGTLGLQFAEKTHVFEKDEGFIVPANTKVRIFNAGSSDLRLIEVLRPAYTEQRAEIFDSF
ncbi:MAG: cupin domain-containing protein, partial [Flavobacteriales bacterium]